jgi:hypothetical protein
MEKRKPGPKRTIKVNDDAFSIFNIESCYWAGFIAADGCVSGNQLKIDLNSCDIEHLQKLKEYLDLSSPIIKSKNRNSHYIHFRSDKIVEDLKNNFKIVPCKSLILEPPNVPDVLDRHYIRGYFDGDGCLSGHKNKLNFEIYSGSKVILEWIKNKIVVHNNLISKVNVNHKSGNCFRFSFCGKQVKIIMNWLYEDCGANFLERKRLKYQFLMEE